MNCPYTPGVNAMDVIELLLIGLAAGLIGGLLGIGGSIIMIPALTIFRGPHQHLYQAAAMIINVLVALSATYRHRRAGAIRKDVVWKMLPAGLIAITVGVMLSNQLKPDLLRACFGVFMLYTAAMEVWSLLRSRSADIESTERTGWTTCGSLGGVMGFSAGLLGIGGGGVAVPLLRRVARLPMRECIATSAAVMLVTSIAGAVQKNLTLESIPPPETATLTESLTLAALLAPGGLFGARVGAGLTHRLPIRWVRVAFVLLLIAAGARMLRIW